MRRPRSLRRPWRCAWRAPSPGSVPSRGSPPSAPTACSPRSPSPRLPPTPVPALQRLGAAGDGAELLTTLRTVLDAGDDLTGAAAALHVHRSTLHRRLRRIEELGAVDLHDGATRLLLHAGLVVAELRAAPG